MRVFVQGATGVLGTTLVREFASRGDDVIGLSRSGQGDARVRAAGGTPAKADIFDAKQLAEAGKGCDLFIQAATKVALKGRVKPADFKENDKLRTQGAEALFEAAIAAGASQYLAESIVWVAQPKDGGPFTEASAVRADPLLNATRLGEMHTLERAKEAGVPAAVLRMGWFYGPSSRHLRDFAQAARKGKFPIIGSGTTPFSFLHTDDAGTAFVAASDAKVAGTFHVVDDHGATIGQFFEGVAKRVGGRPPRHAPKLIARLVAGGYTVRFLTTPMVTKNHKFRAATKWAPSYPSVNEGLDQVAASWKAEGFLT